VVVVALVLLIAKKPTIGGARRGNCLIVLVVVVALVLLMAKKPTIGGRDAGVA
jgi:hypothetical protein